MGPCLKGVGPVYTLVISVSLRLGCYCKAIEKVGLCDLEIATCTPLHQFKSLAQDFLAQYYWGAALLQ